MRDITVYVYADLDDPVASENLMIYKGSIAGYVDVSTFWEQSENVLRYGAMLV